ncbi:Non-repetitive/WGA-negative nucleoporin C-terminal-domain-containing protein [Corynascus novoguineensis]|uniref:Non-repetitive/WGA-negative nucleoporin C-terminal-domain-containing protein n=1 Tax=Corynascus novoguineensis TaxID=1126955 RepID=A0AAN7CU81_9PEZI|nr:Non-repetitive/WGA-negative nucleoporin C-terminal-domain-containing protein [Corynascus novoguineensis]
MNPVTPVRQIPGAFINTPGPNTVRRRLNFNEAAGVGTTSTTVAAPEPIASTMGAGQQEIVTGMLPAPQARDDLPPVVKAAQVINQTLQLDESYPDIDSYCRPGASSDYDIQYADSSWAPFQKTSTYPIPDQVFSRLNEGAVSTKIGLFASINYAWAAIDDSLFLWDYTHPDPELIGYEDATHTITAVALVPPKPGVFVDTITHILVVATTTEITLLGVSATPTPSGSRSVTLYQTKMSVHRGSSDVSHIVGTASGRIFLGGDTDTDIHELFYQQEERWFSSRCGKINHTHQGWSSVVPSLPIAGLPFGQRQQEGLTALVVDDTRNLLYSLSNRSTIRTYHMETPEKLTRVIEKDKTSCLRDFAHMADSSPLFTDRTNIVSLSPIFATEASKLHLMALTDTGCRLFFSATSSASYTLGGSTSLAPQSMQLQFVKFPPKEPGVRTRTVTGQTTEAQLDKTSRALDPSGLGVRFAPGYFFDVVRKHSSSDVLFVSAPDTGKIKATTPASALKYYEQGTWVDLENGSRILEIGLTTAPFSASKQPLGFGNELAVQFDSAPAEFAVLTNTGVHVVRRRRLVDIFANAIRTCAGEEGLEREVRKFLNQYGRVETISAALAVACGQGSDLRTGTGRAPDQKTEDLARMAFVEYGGQPRLAESDGKQLVSESVRLSSRHDALALYLTRLIRTLWKSKVIATKGEAKGSLAVSSTVPGANLIMIQENIERLRNFLEANKSTIQGLAGPSDRLFSRQEEIANQKEHQALHGLRKLMESVSEGISFVLMLFDERVSDIYARLDPTSQQQLQDLTYEQLFSQNSGRELAKVLVKAIVNRNIASGANVETVADALRRRCGSFCSPDDVVTFKAQEQLQRASEQVHNPNVLRTLLGESLRLFEQVAGSLTPSNLQSAVEQYTQLNYYAGAIQLCLTVAQQKDRGNTALTWVNDGKPPNDSRKKAFDERKACYALIHQVLDKLEVAFAGEPEVVDGRPTLAATKRNEAYTVVNDSSDELFHFDLYEWYIEKNWTDRLLAVDSPHVVTYLQRLAETEYQHAELLCRFYTHRSRFFEAAQVQATLAKSDLNIGIKDRITLLSRAKSNASVNTIGVSRQQQQLLNHEVTELLEIAHIQDDLLERLRADTRISPDKLPDIEEALDGPIKGVTELYNEYADQAAYFDLCLLIYHAADYHNPRVITDTWLRLIEQTAYETEQRQAYWQLAQAGRPLPEGAPPVTGEPPLPYESVSQQIQLIAHRTSLDSLVFPVDTLLPEVCKYAVNNGQDASIGADPSWPVLLFLNLGVPHALVVQVLENVFDAQEAPFTGRRRRIVVQWIAVAVEAWVREVERRAAGAAASGGSFGVSVGAGGAGSGGVGGDGMIGAWVSELLARADECLAQIAPVPASARTASGQASVDAEEVLELRRVIKALKRSVDAILGGEGLLGGSLFR